MISWMQRHRKYLVVTIWISTIAFVGAGFVGWGSYEFGGGGSNVAKVGNIKIDKASFASTYSNIYEYYNKLFDGKLDQKQAKAMGLENMAMQTLINQALIENYAKDLELEVSDEEVAAKIGSMESFYINGSFNKNAYLSTLKANNLRPKDFEQSIRKELLAQKISEIMKVKPTTIEESMLSTALLGSDRIEMKLLKLSEMKPLPSEEQIKQLWETNKASYKSEPSFDIEMVWVESKAYTPTTEELQAELKQNSAEYKNSDGNQSTFEQAKPKLLQSIQMQLAKKDALKRFLELKNGSAAGQKLQKVDSKSVLLTAEALSQIAKLKEGETTRPIQQPKGFAIVKLLKTYPSEQLGFEQAKSAVRAQLSAQMAQEMLKQQAAAQLASFGGKDIGFVSRLDADKLAGLSKEEANKALQAIFENKSDRFSVDLGDKIALIHILEQKLFDEEQMKTKKEMIDERVSAIKSGLINQNMIEWLQQRYEIKLYK